MVDVASNTLSWIWRWSIKRLEEERKEYDLPASVSERHQRLGCHTVPEMDRPMLKRLNLVSGDRCSRRCRDGRGIVKSSGPEARARAIAKAMSSQ